MEKNIVNEMMSIYAFPRWQPCDLQIFVDDEKVSTEI